MGVINHRFWYSHGKNCTYDVPVYLDKIFTGDYQRFYINTEKIVPYGYERALWGALYFEKATIEDGTEKLDKYFVVIILFKVGNNYYYGIYKIRCKLPEPEYDYFEIALSSDQSGFRSAGIITDNYLYLVYKLPSIESGGNIYPRFILRKYSIDDFELLDEKVFMYGSNVNMPRWYDNNIYSTISYYKYEGNRNYYWKFHGIMYPEEITLDTSDEYSSTGVVVSDYGDYALLLDRQPPGYPPPPTIGYVKLNGSIVYDPELDPTFGAQTIFFIKDTNKLVVMHGLGAYRKGYSIFPDGLVKEIPPLEGYDKKSTVIRAMAYKNYFLYYNKDLNGGSYIEYFNLDDWQTGETLFNVIGVPLYSVFYSDYLLLYFSLKWKVYDILNGGEVVDEISGVIPPFNISQTYNTLGALRIITNSLWGIGGTTYISGGNTCYRIVVDYYEGKEEKKSSNFFSFFERRPYSLGRNEQ